MELPKPEDKMPQSATCQRCNLKAIYHELGGVRVWTCPRCMTQHPYVSSKKKKDSFRFVMFSFIAGLVFLTLGNLDKTPFSHVPEDPDEARRRLRSEHIAAIMKATQESEKNPNKRKRTNLAQNAKLYDQIHGENEQLVAEFNAEAEIKNAQDPNFEIPNRREFWKLLGAFTATVDGEVELFVFGLGPNSHLGQVHELESKSVKKIFWPAVASVKSLTIEELDALRQRSSQDFVSFKCFLDGAFGRSINQDLFEKLKYEIAICERQGSTQAEESPDSSSETASESSSSEDSGDDVSSDEDEKDSDEMKGVKSNCTSAPSTNSIASKSQPKTCGQEMASEGDSDVGSESEASEAEEVKEPPKACAKACDPVSDESGESDDSEISSEESKVKPPKPLNSSEESEHSTGSDEESEDEIEPPKQPCAQTNEDSGGSSSEESDSDGSSSEDAKVQDVEGDESQDESGSSDEDSDEKEPSQRDDVNHLAPIEKAEEDQPVRKKAKLCAEDDPCDAAKIKSMEIDSVVDFVTVENAEMNSAENSVTAINSAASPVGSAIDSAIDSAVNFVTVACPLLVARGDETAVDSAKDSSDRM